MSGTTEAQVSLLDPAILGQFSGLRRNVFDNQVKPDLMARAAWLAFPQSSRPQLDNEEPTKLASILLNLTQDLDGKITEADKPDRHRTWDGYHLRLYNSPYFRGFDIERGMNGLAISHDYQGYSHNAVDFQAFNRAVRVMFQTLQGAAPLKPGYSWEELVAVYQAGFKTAPTPPKEIIWSCTGQDDGPLNEGLALELPTKIPFVNVHYGFKAHGEYGGVNRVDPDWVSINVVRLDPEYLRRSARPGQETWHDTPWFLRQPRPPITADTLIH